MKTDLKERTYHVAPKILHAALARVGEIIDQDVHQVLAQKKLIQIKFKNRKRPIDRLEFTATEMRQVFDAFLKAQAIDNRAHSYIKPVLNALVTAVDADSRAVVLGVNPQPIQKTRRALGKETVRVYMHTLDGRPAVFNGRDITHAELQVSRHHPMPKDLPALRRQQTQALRAYLRLTETEYDKQKARLSWVSYIVEPLPTKS